MVNPNPPAPRVLAPFRLASELLEWVEVHSAPGDLFGSYSHAVERALRRLQLEHSLLWERCKQEGLRFSREAVAGLYADDLEATKPSRGGRPFKDPARNATEGRERATATVDPGLLEWARDTLVDAGPFESMSQAVEVGLRHLRAEEPALLGNPTHPFDADAFWAAYKQVAPAKRTR